MSDKHLELLGKILRQAEKAGTEEEAAVFMAKAQQLSTRHSIDLEIARQHVADKSARKVPEVRQTTVGEQGKRGLGTYCTLYLRIAQANDVRVNLAHNSTYVIAFGFASDIDVVDALYNSLVVQMVEASAAYLRTGEYKDELVWNYRRGEYRPVHRTTARLSFQDAFAERVGARLKLARAKAIEEMETLRVAEVATHEIDESTPGTELVLRNKEIEVKEFYSAKSTARGSWRGGYGGGSSGARTAGRKAGNSARLGGEKSIGGSSRGIAS